MKPFTLLFLFVTVLFPDSPVPQEPKPQGTPLAFSQLGPKRSGPRTSYAGGCGIWDRRRMVIRDRETWGDVWKQLNVGHFVMGPAPGRELLPSLPPLPEIDFSRKMLLVVTMGMEPTSGYAITVDGVYEQANQLQVIVGNVSPGSSCFTFQSATEPVDIVELDKRDGSLIFRDIDIVTDCKQTRPAP